MDTIRPSDQQLKASLQYLRSAPDTARIFFRSVPKEHWVDEKVFSISSAMAEAEDNNDLDLLLHLAKSLKARVKELKG